MASPSRLTSLGERVKYFRTLAEKSQADIATTVGVSRNYITMIEKGERLVTKRDTLDALAAALGVTPNDLTGQPYTPTTVSDYEAHQVIPRIRAALTEPDDGPVTPRPINELDIMVDKAMVARMECDVPALGANLPAALAELRELWFTTGDPTAGVLLVKAAVTGSLALKAAGWVDLGIRLSELAETVANSHGDPVAIAAAQFAVAQCALTVGSRRRSARLAVVTVNTLDQLTRTKLPPNVFNDVMAWMGVMHLHAALSEATIGGDAQAHLAAAAAAAPRVVGNPWHMEFSPANVGVWSVGIALEEGNPDLTHDLMRRVNTRALLTRQRRSRLWLDAGRGAHAVGNYDEAVRLLTLADQAAPGDLRQRATAVETVRHLINTPGVARSEQLRNLAVNVGVAA